MKFRKTASLALCAALLLTLFVLPAGAVEYNVGALSTLDTRIASATATDVYNITAVISLSGSLHNRTWDAKGATFQYKKSAGMSMLFLRDGVALDISNATFDGGALATPDDAGLAFDAAGGSLTLTNVTIQNCLSSYPVIYPSGSSSYPITLTDVTITGNATTSAFEAVLRVNCPAVLTDTTVSGNNNTAGGPANMLISGTNASLTVNGDTVLDGVTLADGKAVAVGSLGAGAMIAFDDVQDNADGRVVATNVTPADLGYFTVKPGSKLALSALNRLGLSGSNLVLRAFIPGSFAFDGDTPADVVAPNAGTSDTVTLKRAGHADVVLAAGDFSVDANGMLTIKKEALGLLASDTYSLVASKSGDVRTLGTLAITNTREPILGPPPGVVATQSGGDIEVTWSAVSGATGYEIYRWKVGAGYSASLVGTTPGGITSFTDTGAAGDGYAYLVRATGLFAGQPVHGEFSYITYYPAGESPPQVTNLTGTGGTNSVTLSWDALSGVSGYRIFKELPDHSYELIDSVPAGTTTHTVTGLTAGSYQLIVVPFWDFTVDTIPYRFDMAPAFLAVTITGNDGGGNGGEWVTVWGGSGGSKPNPNTGL